MERFEVSEDVLLECVKKQARKDDVQIESMESSEVEGSEALRVRVSYRVKGTVHNKSFEVKRSRQSNREVFFMSKAVALMKDVGGRRISPPLPECYHAVSDDKGDLIVIEDLTEIGYRPHPGVGADLQHCSMGLSRLGMLHGFSIAVERSTTKRSGGWLGLEPALREDELFYEESEERPSGAGRALMRLASSIAAALAPEVSPDAESACFSGKLEEALEQLWSAACQMVLPVVNGPNVLSHGDCWLNNVLYRYEKGGSSEKLMDAKFVDFRRVRYAHPCLDIACFLHLGTSRSFRKRYTNELLLAYCNALVDALNSMGKGTPPVTLGEIRHELNFKYKDFGIIMAFLMKPILTLDSKYSLKKVEDCAEDDLEGWVQDSFSVIKEHWESSSTYKKNLIEMLEEFFELALPLCS